MARIAQRGSAGHRPRRAHVQSPSRSRRRRIFLALVFGSSSRDGDRPISAPVRSADEIEAVIAGLGRDPPGGIVTGFDGYLMVNRGTVFALAARNKVPAVCPIRVF